jgi:hypothetical protein
LVLSGRPVAMTKRRMSTGIKVFLGYWLILLGVGLVFNFLDGSKVFSGWRDLRRDTVQRVRNRLYRLSAPTRNGTRCGSSDKSGP